MKNLDYLVQRIDQLAVSPDPLTQTELIELIRSIDLCYDDWSTLMNRYRKSANSEVLVIIAFGLCIDADHYPPGAALEHVLDLAEDALSLRQSNVLETCLTAIQTRLGQADRSRPFGPSEAQRLHELLFGCLSGPWKDLFTMQTAVLSVLSVICYFRPLTEVFPPETMPLLLDQLIQVRIQLVEGPFAEQADEIIACVRKAMA
jgi:hypothetical protein